MRYFALAALSICFIFHSQVRANDLGSGSGDATKECIDFIESNRSFNECLDNTVARAKYDCTVNACGLGGAVGLVNVYNVKCSWKRVQKGVNLDIYDTTCKVDCDAACATH